MGPKFENGDRVVHTDACGNMTYGCIIGPMPGCVDRWAVMPDGKHDIQVWPASDTQMAVTKHLPTQGWMMFHDGAWVFTESPQESSRWQAATGQRTFHVLLLDAKKTPFGK